MMRLIMAYCMYMEPLSTSSRRFHTRVVPDRSVCTVRAPGNLASRLALVTSLLNTLANIRVSGPGNSPARSHRSSLDESRALLELSVYVTRINGSVRGAFTPTEPLGRFPGSAQVLHPDHLVAFRRASTKL